MQKYKSGDIVLIVTGKDKGKKGKILKVDPKNNLVTVEKVNVAKKHQKPSQQSQGGIIEISLPIHWSNVRLIDPNSDKATGISYVVNKSKKVRKAKVSGELII